MRNLRALTNTDLEIFQLFFFENVSMNAKRTEFGKK